MAGTSYDAIPEELHVKEILVTKGMAQKRMRIMGRGRTGFGYKRWSHVTMKVEVINFDEKILKSKSIDEQKLWIKRKALVENLKENPVEFALQRKNKKGPKKDIQANEA